MLVQRGVAPYSKFLVDLPYSTACHATLSTTVRQTRCSNETLSLQRGTTSGGHGYPSYVDAYEPCPAVKHSAAGHAWAITRSAGHATTRLGLSRSRGRGWLDVTN